MTRTPQEKKRLSYAKDRRNVYRENSKASRKGIPLAKARANRAHAQDHLLSQALVSAGADQLTSVETEVRGTKPREWRKTPDKPLGEALARRAARKARRDAP
jgi:hypothetical protein